MEDTFSFPRHFARGERFGGGPGLEAAPGEAGPLLRAGRVARVGRWDDPNSTNGRRAKANEVTQLGGLEPRQPNLMVWSVAFWERLNGKHLSLAIRQTKPTVGGKLKRWGEVHKP